jgi:hypothetical protein
MTEYRLTKQAVKRFYESPITVRLWNGCFNRAVVIAKFSRHTIELSVDVTHPELVWQCGDKKEVSLVDWREGLVRKPPKELEPLVERMKQMATMSDEEAAKISTRNKQSFYDSMRELGMFR